jgi:hypothetical protein
MKKLLFILGFLCFSGVSLAQITLTNLPSTTGNTRFFSEIHSNIKRPGLSVIGFDNGGNDQFGYGLEQVIENIYNGSDEIIFEEILDIAKTSITSTPTSSGQAETNGNILQYAAFEALVALVLEENDAEVLELVVKEWMELIEQVGMTYTFTPIPFTGHWVHWESPLMKYLENQT